MLSHFVETQDSVHIHELHKSINPNALYVIMGVASPKPGVGSNWKSSTLLVLNERIIRKITEYPSYMSAFFAMFSQNWPKIDVFRRKTAKKWSFRMFCGCAVRRKKILGFLGLQYPHRAPILTPNFALGSSWGGARSDPTPLLRLVTCMIIQALSQGRGHGLQVPLSLSSLLFLYVFLLLLEKCFPL